MVLASLISIANYDNQGKTTQGMRYTIVCYFTRLYFFQIIMGRHVSVLYRILASIEIRITRHANAKTNHVETMQHRYLII